jgi:hypothetical protein
MTAPLDEKGLADAHDAFYATENSNSRDMMRNAIRAYLAAPPSPSMEMEVVAWRRWHWDARNPGMLEHPGGAWVLVADAQSALSAMAAERDDARDEHSFTLRLLNDRIKALEEALRAVSHSSHRARDRKHYRFPMGVMEKVDAALSQGGGNEGNPVETLGMGILGRLVDLPRQEGS